MIKQFHIPKSLLVHLFIWRFIFVFHLLKGINWNSLQYIFFIFRLIFNFLNHLHGRTNLFVISSSRNRSRVMIFLIYY